MLSHVPKTYQHEYYKKKSNYLRDVTHFVRDKEWINICKCCYLQLFVKCIAPHELKMVDRIMRGIRVENQNRENFSSISTV